MTVPFDAPAWSSLLLGLAALSAGIGALRKPGIWRTMIDEVNGSPALQFLCGLLEMLIGGIIYLANPWVPSDVLSCLMKALGGLMMIEAIAILAFCDIYTQMWLRSLANMHRGWAITTVVFGLALNVAGAMRFN